jgi:hypothetical protein
MEASQNPRRETYGRLSRTEEAHNTDLAQPERAAADVTPIPAALLRSIQEASDRVAGMGHLAIAVREAAEACARAAGRIAVVRADSSAMSPELLWDFIRTELRIDPLVEATEPHQTVDDLVAPLREAVLEFDTALDRLQRELQTSTPSEAAELVDPALQAVQLMERLQLPLRNLVPRTRKSFDSGIDELTVSVMLANSWADRSSRRREDTPIAQRSNVLDEGTTWTEPTEAEVANPVSRYEVQDRAGPEKASPSSGKYPTL